MLIRLLKSLIQHRFVEILQMSKKQEYAYKDKYYVRDLMNYLIIFIDVLFNEVLMTNYLTK